MFNGPKNASLSLGNMERLLEQYFPSSLDNALRSGRCRALDMVFDEFMMLNPGIFFVPAKYGGLGASVGESLAMLDLISYHRLSFGLTIGINSALFIWPLELFASDGTKSAIYRKLVQERKIGGLMLTEPDHGSDLLNMEASFVSHEGCYRITGTKHWAGLTGRADYWLVAARSGETHRGGRRPIGFFVCKQDIPCERIVVEDYYDSAGLQPITYGRSRLDLEVPASQRLLSNHHGLDILRTTLSHSRMVICAMAAGAVRRLRDECIEFAGARMIGRRTLLSYDLTQHFVGQLDARLAVLSGLCRHLSTTWRLGLATVEQFEAARILKVIATDYMGEASDRAVQIFASSGYRESSVAWTFFRDARAFRIFEGPNELLYMQIGSDLVTRLRQMGLCSLGDYLKEGGFRSDTQRIFQDMAETRLVDCMSQRELWRVGVLASRLAACDWLLRQSLRVEPQNEDAVETLRAEAAAAITSLRHDIGKKLHDPTPRAMAWWKMETSRIAVTEVAGDGELRDLEGAQYALS